MSPTPHLLDLPQSHLTDENSEWVLNLYPTRVDIQILAQWFVKNVSIISAEKDKIMK